MVRDMISARGRLLAGTALTGMVLAFAGSAAANPTDPTVISGTVGFGTDGSVLEVRQGSDKAIIDWRGFDIAAGETTRFVQPGAGSVALNRVTGGQASSIDGALTANGRIFLINPNGILFGAGSSVDVGALVATTADIANDRFLAGDYRFDIASPVAGASIANAGTINAGMAALVAPQVRNSGTIQATLGSATLGAAQRFTLDLAGDGLISFDASSAIDGARVVQSGLVRGSSVLLSAATASRVVDNVIDMSGVVEARSARQDGGDIVLDGGLGVVALGGTLDNSAAAGGDIRVLGPVTLTGDSTLVTAGGAGDDIRITGTVNGANALIADAGKGTVTFDSAVGGTSALKLLSAGGSTVSLKSVTTTGLQDYAGTVTLAGDLVSTVGGGIRVGGPVTLAADSAIVTAGNGGDDVKVTGAINGPYALLVDAGKGKVALDGAVGGSSALKLLSAGGSTVSLKSVTTTGLQDYAGAVTLAGDLVSTVGGGIRVGGPVTLAADSAIVTAGNGGDDVKVTGAVNGAYVLLVDAGKGKAALDGAVGATSALKLLSVGGSTVSLKSVTTTGLQDYAGTVTLAGDLISTVGGGIRVGGPVTLAADSAIVTAGKGGDDVKVTGAVNGAYALLVDAGKGKVALDGAVGGSSALKLLSVGGSTVSLKSVTTTGLQDYAGAVTLAGDLVSTVGGGIRVGGPLTLAGNAKLATAGAGADNVSLEGPVSGAYQLSVQAGKGAVTAAGAVNGLSGLDVAGGVVSLASPISVTGTLGLAGTTVKTGTLSGRSVVLTGTDMLTAGAITATETATVTAGKAASLSGITANQITIGAGEALTVGALVATKDLTVTGAKAVTLTTATAESIAVTAGDALTANSLTAVKSVTATGAKAVTLTNVAGAQVAATAGGVLSLASLTADTASLSGGMITGSGTLRVKGVLRVDTAGRATLSDVQVGGLAYRGAGTFNADGSVAGVSGVDAADLVTVLGDRNGTYLFAGRPVFGIASTVERHRLDVPLVQTVPTTDRDDDARAAAPVLDPARAAEERDGLIEIRD